MSDVRFDVEQPFVARITVRPQDIDMLGHANHKSYLAWIEEAAVGDTIARGFGMERFRTLGGVWVVKRHLIEYFAPAFEGEDLMVGTWPSKRTIFTQVRRCQVIRARDAQLLCRSETLWVFIDPATGRPTPFPDEVLAAFAPMD